MATLTKKQAGVVKEVILEMLENEIEVLNDAFNYGLKINKWIPAGVAKIEIPT
jgi:hypothetical protein